MKKVEDEEDEPTTTIENLVKVILNEKRARKESIGRSLTW